MRRICFWLAQIRADNVHVVIFVISVVIAYLFSLVIIASCAIQESWANLLWLAPWTASAMAALLFAADFDKYGVRRNNISNIHMYDDFCKMMDQRDALKKERDRLYKLRNTRTI